jgi:hypothetical protein
MKEPKLRTVEKYRPPYPLNEFPEDFALKLGREIVYLLATRNAARVEGPDWEEIFAKLVGADWKPSNVGLDDIVLEQTAWGAKTVKNSKPSSAFKVRLISGRNSPVYSFGDQKVSKRDPEQLGEKVLAIWNERVAAVRKRFRHVRTIVLLKSDDLLELAAFEFETAIYPADGFRWQWNEKGNLEGFAKRSDDHRFTWQPHGSQFTIIEDVPKNRLALRVRKPPRVDHDKVLADLLFDETWVEIIN